MADTFTPFLNLTKPDIGGDTDTWGQLLNNDMDLIDAGVKAASNSATAANTAATAAQTTANTAFATASSFGQCRFVFVSSTQCRLNRYNGQYVIINGTPQSIPSAGENLSNSGLTAGNLYYVYVYMNGSPMTL